jgi:SnoaL-like domain
MVINTSALEFVDCINRYLAALERSDFDSVVALFSPQAVVSSPFLGRLAPRPFYEQVAGVTATSKPEAPELFVSASGSRRAIGYFNYIWALKSGVQVAFPCADVFEFTREGLICDLSIVYDTEPVRRVIGASYGLPVESALSCSS